MYLTKPTTQPNSLKAGCIYRQLAVFLLLIGGFVASNCAMAGQVAVSNYPLYLLSQAITQGNDDALMLLQAGDVGHHGSLPPSKVYLMKNATYVVWFGDSLESNLATQLKGAKNAISLLDMKAFHKKPLRDIDGKPKANTTDPHIWLDPTNAKAIVAALTVVHSYANPHNRAIYQQNANAFYRQMDKVAAQAKLPKTTPYWAYHDSFSYLEDALNLRFAGALTPDHHLSPKASRFRILTQNRPNQTMCLASQGAISQGIQDKLQPIYPIVRQEDMSDSTSFIEGWQTLASEFGRCMP